MRIQLLYFEGCPHVEETRVVLRSALAACAIPDVTVEELDVEAATTPSDLRGWGSPTILVDGVDLLGERSATGMACRVYPGAELSGVPPRELIELRLREAVSSHLRRKSRA